MLILPIKKQWLDMIIINSEKKEEYREIKPYYTKRFQSVGLLDSNGNTTNQCVEIALRNGYSINSPTLFVKVVLKKGQGRKEWGAVEGEEYYCLQIVELEKLVVNGETQWRSMKG